MENVKCFVGEKIDFYREKEKGEVQSGEAPSASPSMRNGRKRFPDRVAHPP